MNKFFEVFTKKYREEIKRREFLEKNIDQFKLSPNNYDVEERVETLKQIAPQSGFEFKFIKQHSSKPIRCRKKVLKREN